VKNDEFSLELPTDWNRFLCLSNWSSAYQELYWKLQKEYSLNSVFPSPQNIFRAFELTKVDDLKCVLIGQDPYHGYNQANGLAFSVNVGVKTPPSLGNLLKELKEDLRLSEDVMPKSDLTQWASQGVLLLNRVLTVKEGEPNSHKEIGWECFTEFVLLEIARQKPEVVFILLGNSAQSMQSKLKKYTESIISAPHPSPLSAHRGFLGARIFSKTNRLLAENQINPIEWF
jgi:uracil-DNA glycosylase